MKVEIKVDGAKRIANQLRTWAAKHPAEMDRLMGRWVQATRAFSKANRIHHRPLAAGTPGLAGWQTHGQLKSKACPDTLLSTPVPVQVG